MGDQWYYNYNSVNYPPPNTQDPNSQVPTNATHIQWHQYQNNIPGAPFVPYPPVPSYPPPVGGPFNLPPQPPCVSTYSSFGYYNNYPQGAPTNQNPSYGAWPPPPPTNDYTKELENYKYIKSKITEESRDLKSRER